jgi:hypothetical protein
VGLTVQSIGARIKVQPTIPVPAGLQVRELSADRGFIVLNMERVPTQTYRYAVVAIEPGEYDIGPLKVMDNSGSVSAPAVHLKVTPRSAATVEALAADLSALTVYVGQSLVYHLKYQTASRLVSGRWAPPEVEGLMVEPGVEPVTTEYRVEDNGRPLSVQEMWYPWRATKAGTFSVPPGVLQAQFAVERKRNRPGFDDPFFGDLPGFTDIRTDNVLSPRLSVEVRPLPTEGRPDNFLGLIGEFSLTSTASSTTAAVGETVTVDIALTGNGSLSGFALPTWSGVGYRVYDDTPVTESKLADGALVSTARFKRAVVPETPGTITLPPVSVSWFSPEQGAFVVQQTEAIELQVGGTASEAAIEGFGPATPPRTAVASLGDDILPVRTQFGIAPRWPGKWAWIALIPGMSLLVGQALPHFRRRPKTMTVERLRFENLPLDPEARLSGLEQIFREEAAIRLGRSAPELVLDDVAPLGPEASALYRELDLARYRGGTDPPEDRLRKWLEQA